MTTLGELKKNPRLIAELGGEDFLVAAVDETVLQQTQSPQGATVIFEHETMKMMMAERAQRVEKLAAQLGDDAQVIPLRKKDQSFWDHITLGRAKSADIVLDDPAISNAHAHFELDDDERMSVQDVGSSNGTHVNRVPLQPHIPTQLTSGDVVRFGQTIFYYVRRSTLNELCGGS